MALTSLVIAASTLAGSVVSTDTKLMPKLSNTLLRSLYVPPYTLSDMMSLSPCLKRLRTVVIAARLYGGIGGALVAGFGDIIGCIVHPVGAWFPPITLTYAFSGFIYGLLLHKKANLVRIFIAIGITQLLISLFATTLWIAFLSYKNDMMFFEFYLTRVGLRIWQVLVMSVVQAVIIPPMLKALDKIKLFKIMN